MKFEKLSESNGKVRRVFLYGLITGVGLLIIFNLFLTKAKYKVVDNAKLVNSTINYSNADFNLIAIYLQEGTNDNPLNSYKKVENGIIPAGNIKLNEQETYCKIGEEELKGKNAYNREGITIKLNNNTVDFTGIKQAGTKCYLYLDLKPKGNPDTTKDNLHLVVNTTQDGCPTINEDGSTNIISNFTESKGLLCEGKDDYGITYYFRGLPDNNWVKIGNTYWQIIRINGNGTIRLIYNGNSANRQSSTTLAKTRVQYNNNYDDNAYVGFMYGLTMQYGEEAYNKTHANTNKSNVLTELEAWYKENDLKQHEDILDGATGFCNDRTPYYYNGEYTLSPNQSGVNNLQTNYGPSYRIQVSKKITFKCPQASKDLFTTNIEQGSGNGKLDYPVGLITADETVYAGGSYSETNKNYYLYNGQYYWTMSPDNFISSLVKAYVYFIRGDYGNLGDYQPVNLNIGVRPVINLKDDTTFEEGGEGTSSKPFTVKLN